MYYIVRDVDVNGFNYSAYYCEQGFRSNNVFTKFGNYISFDSYDDAEKYINEHSLDNCRIVYRENKGK